MGGRHAVTEARGSRRRRRGLNLGLLLPAIIVLATIAVVTIGLLGQDENPARSTQVGPTTQVRPTAKPVTSAAKAPGTGLAGAQSTLQSWLRAVGKGEASACDRYATPAFAESRFGSMAKCRWHLKHITQYNSAKEVQALKTAIVRGGTVDSKGKVVVDFAELSWSSGSMTAQTTEPRHTLQWDGDSWVLV